MLYFRKHAEGPDIPEDTKEKTFRSYVDMANWADEHLPFGKYYIRNNMGATLYSALRSVEFTKTHFWVEGRGNV